MFEQVIPSKTKRALALLGKSRILKDAYLAGGTALALHIGHRISKDLDFFTSKKFNEKIIIERLSELGIEFRLENTDWQTILGHLGKTRFSLFYYTYPLLDAPQEFSFINIASVRDLAPMKLAAISDRGTKRDFMDLYFIVAVEKFFTLREVFDLYDKKFKLLDANKIHLLKSLTYFEDADATTVPRMLQSVTWTHVKKFFKEQTKKLIKELLT